MCRVYAYMTGHMQAHTPLHSQIQLDAFISAPFAIVEFIFWGSKITADCQFPMTGNCCILFFFFFLHFLLLFWVLLGAVSSSISLAPSQRDIHI